MLWLAIGQETFHQKQQKGEVFCNKNIDSKKKKVHPLVSSSLVFDLSNKLLKLWKNQFPNQGKLQLVIISELSKESWTEQHIYLHAGRERFKQRVRL